MDPFTLILGIAGVSSGLFGSILGGVGKKQQADAQARALDQQAQVAGYQAQNAQQRGNYNAGMARIQGSEKIGQDTNAYSGIDTSQGTPADHMADVRFMSEADAQQIKANAAMEAWGYKVQGQQAVSQASQARSQGNLAFAGSIIGGIGQAAGGAKSSGLVGSGAPAVGGAGG